jgi:hypothetical protein
MDFAQEPKMKITIKSGTIPDAFREGEAANVDAARPHAPARRTAREVEIEISSEFPIESVIDPALAQEIADYVRTKIDNKLAEEAFLISRRHDFVPGNEAGDWADRLQAEINVEGGLRTHYSDRRHSGRNDRRRAAVNDRRVG